MSLLDYKRHINHLINYLKYTLEASWPYSKSNPVVNDPSDGWDGKFKGLEVNPGVFVYIVNYKIDDQDLIEAGAVSVIR